MTSPSAADLAVACRFAAELIDREEHRYVERFAPCPNGCQFTYPDEVHVVIDGQQQPWPSDQPFNPPLVRTAGPADCALCDGGTIEDEHAPWCDELVANVRAAADRLDAEAIVAATEEATGLDRAAIAALQESATERPRGLDALIPPAPGDLADLPEDVDGHTMGRIYTHDDERVCAYHRRLDLWVTQTSTSRWSQCLRVHPYERP